jgi:hypothetical protein
MIMVGWYIKKAYNINHRTMILFIYYLIKIILLRVFQDKIWHTTTQYKDYSLN